MVMWPNNIICFMDEASTSGYSNRYLLSTTVLFLFLSLLRASFSISSFFLLFSPLLFAAFLPEIYILPPSGSGRTSLVISDIIGKHSFSFILNLFQIFILFYLQLTPWNRIKTEKKLQCQTSTPHPLLKPQTIFSQWQDQSYISANYIHCSTKLSVTVHNSHPKFFHMSS